MKSVLQITCDECRLHLADYLHNDTPPLLRRRISRHIDHCPACYALYSQELELMRELKGELPKIGAGDTASFNRVWAGIQAEIYQPTPPRFQMRYGLAMLALILVFLVPMTMGNRNPVLADLPTPPQPISARLTPGITEPSITETTIALLTEDSQTTPEALGIAAPTVNVTSTPEHEG